MIRRRLSLQLALVMLGVALVPLLGAGLLTLHLIERSVTGQARAAQLQIGRAAAALVRDYLKDAATKLGSIARMIRKEEDPREQTRRLNSLLDPPDIFLEVAYWTSGNEPKVQAQVQQGEYNLAQKRAKPQNRAFQENVGQQVQTFTNATPQILEAQSGNGFMADRLQMIESFPSLPISVPAPGGLLSADLDFRPVSQLLAALVDEPSRRLLLLDNLGAPLARSSAIEILAPISTIVDVGHGGWTLHVDEAAAVLRAPLDQAYTRVILWFALAGAAAVALAFLFASRVTRPLQTLVLAADRIAGGDLGARAGLHREDEIGQLASAFDRMAVAVEQIDRLKDEFVAHVSHELRTPLTSAKIALANVREGIAGPDALPRVQEDLDRLIRMVNGLLDSARLEAGLTLDRTSVELGSLVRGAVESLRPLARGALDVRGTGDTVDADPARIRQIVLNLVDNAIKYARSRVDVELRGREIRVSDDGPGVPPEQREKIFEKFARLGDGPKPPGAGLGLSIARKLAVLHGGTLVCEGNTFILRLP